MHEVEGQVEADKESRNAVAEVSLYILPDIWNQ